MCGQTGKEGKGRNGAISKIWKENLMLASPLMNRLWGRSLAGLCGDHYSERGKKTPGKDKFFEKIPPP